MNGPRARQRFPDGGKTLYEILRRDYEPHWIEVRAKGDDWRDRDPHGLPRVVRSIEQQIADQEYSPGTVYILQFEPAFDPMTYFWPVKGQHVILRRARPMHADDIRRFVKAMLRGEARLVQVIWPLTRKNVLEGHEYTLQSFGPDVECSAL